MERIEAGLLIAGDEEPVRGGVVLVDGGTISYAGGAGNAPETPAATVHRAAALMPGLWDCHGHFLGSRVFDLGQLPLEPGQLRVGLTGMDVPNSWGTNGTELPHLVRLGMTPLQAIAAATATAPLTLGPQAPKSGRLAAGYDADLITLDADPLADISIIAEPRHVTGVWVRGRQVKGGAAAA